LRQRTRLKESFYVFYALTPVISKANENYFSAGYSHPEDFSGNGEGFR
jgi:hypothetical protein